MEIQPVSRLGDDRRSLKNRRCVFLSPFFFWGMWIYGFQILEDVGCWIALLFFFCVVVSSLDIQLMTCGQEIACLMIFFPW